MRTRIALIGVVALLWFSTITRAQSASTQEERLKRLERRLSDLEERYQRDIRVRDDQIERLRRQVPSTASTRSTDDDIEQTKQEVLRDIESRGMHLSNGFVGTPYLNPVLTRFGRADVAYALLHQKTFPSWLYPVTAIDARSPA